MLRGRVWPGALSSEGCLWAASHFCRKADCSAQGANSAIPQVFTEGSLRKASQGTVGSFTSQRSGLTDQMWTINLSLDLKPPLGYSSRALPHPLRAAGRGQAGAVERGCCPGEAKAVPDRHQNHRNSCIVNDLTPLNALHSVWHLVRTQPLVLLVLFRLALPQGASKRWKEHRC